MERDNVNLTLSMPLTLREFTYLGLIHGHLKWDSKWREREIDIAQVSKNVTYEMYIKRDRDGYGLSDRGRDGDDIDGDGGRDGGRKGDSDGVLGNHDVLCCVLERANLAPLVCFR